MLFHDLRRYFGSKFSEAQKENERLAKKIKTDSHKLKYRGNQLQLDFNDSIIAQLESITRHIKSNLTKKPLKGMKKVIAELETRNKMIKIADKSPGGWKTVEEYLSDSIASDSEDERKLRAAESRALRKKQNPRKPYQYNNVYSATPSATFNHRFRNVQQIQFPTQQSFSPANFQRQQTYFKPYFNSSNYQLYTSLGSKGTTRYTGRSNPSSTCFACGRIGHW